MKVINILIATLIGLICNQSFAQSNTELNLQSFNKIDIRSSAKINLRSGSIQKVVLTGINDSTKNKIIVSDGKLIINGSSSNLDITVINLEELIISGSGSIVSDSGLKCNNLLIEISGNGKVNSTINVSNLVIGISGNGKITTRGTANSLDLNISGNGKLEAENLIVSNVSANISGVGKAYVDVKESLKYIVSGTGAFYYKTEPAKIETQISGIGKYGKMVLNDSDTTTVNIGNKKVIIIGGKEDDEDDNDYSGNFDVNISTDTTYSRPARAKSHWAGIELGFNQFAFGSEMSTDYPSGYGFLELNSGKSINVNINIFAHDFQLYKRYIMFTSGIGLTLNNFRFDSDQTMRKDGDTISAAFDFKETGEQINYRKNKLSVNYVTVPLLIQFNTHEELKKSIHIAVGALMSYKFSSHLKLVYDDNGDKEKSKRRGEYYINPFRADITARVGYRNYTLFASYALTEFFRSNRGPEIHPFQFGVNILGW